MSSLRLPAKARESKYLILAHDQGDESYFLLFLNTSVIQIKTMEGPAILTGVVVYQFQIGQQRV